MSKDQQEYLLKKYLTTDNEELSTNPKRKKKRGNIEQLKNSKKRSTVLIDEDLESSWKKDSYEEEEEAPVYVADEKMGGQFLAEKNSGWEIISGAKEEEKEDSEEEERMLSGAKIGLQSGQEVAADIKRQELLIRRKLQAMKPEDIGRDAETVYRDSKGKKLDLQTEKAKADLKEKEKRELEKAITERNKGLAQKEQKQLFKDALKLASSQSISRYANDVEFNSELKSQPRWEDPASEFLTKSNKKSRYPKYQGPAPPPNRFQILPGYRWDGVDRSNGHEKELFNQINSQKAKAAEIYAWSTEDM